MPPVAQSPTAARCLMDTTVVRVGRPADEHVAIEMLAPGFPPSLPGQFLQVLCRDHDDPAVASHDWNDGSFPLLESPDWSGRGAFLRRPFSIADRWEDEQGRTHLAILSRAVGPGTRFLDALAAGDVLNVAGPLGRPFRVPDGARPLVLIGGGVGIPPLLYLARHLRALDRRDVTVIFGARSGALFPVEHRVDPLRLNLSGGADYPAIVTTDDGSLGRAGRVTDALRDWAADRGGAAAAALVFACGPERMLHAIGELTRELGMECQLCIERTMGCGAGTCLSCVVRVADSTRPVGWRWALSCSEGPVFDRDLLVDGC